MAKVTEAQPKMYHVRDGFSVGRTIDGRVTIELKDSTNKNARVLFTTTLEPAQWASAFAQVCHQGPTDGAVSACIELMNKTK